MTDSDKARQRLDLGPIKMLFLKIFSLQPRYHFFATLLSSLCRAKFALCRESTTGASLLHSAVVAQKWDFCLFLTKCKPLSCARTLKNCFLGISEVKQIFAPHFSISINFINEESKNSQKYKKFLTVYRQGMALHLVLICPALLAAQDSLGRLVGNKLPLLLQLGDVLEAS